MAKTRMVTDHLRVRKIAATREDWVKWAYEAHLTHTSLTAWIRDTLRKAIKYAPDEPPFSSPVAKLLYAIDLLAEAKGEMLASVWAKPDVG